LGVIGLFAAGLYIVMLATGFGELMCRSPKLGSRKKRQEIWLPPANRRT
jgi:hypothetical protein